MQQVVILELDLSSLRRAIGGGSYARGTEYARQQAVTHATWDPEDNALHGAVRGQGGRVYDVAAYFSLPAGRPARFSTSECSCPVGYNCKHVVALVLSALDSAPPDPIGPRGPRPAAWEQSLDSLLAAPGSAAAARPRWPSSSRWPPAGPGDPAPAGAAEADRPAGAAGQERRLGRRRLAGASWTR